MNVPSVLYLNSKKIGKNQYHKFVVVKVVTEHKVTVVSAHGLTSHPYKSKPQQIKSPLGIEIH